MKAELPQGRKDWDWVSMDDYNKDTEDLVQLSNSMLEAYKREVKELKKWIAALVYSAGKIEIPRHLIVYEQNFTVVWEENMERNSIMFKAVL